MTKEEIIKKYDQKRMGGAQNSASSKSALSKEEIIKKYDERQATKTRERQMIEIANRTPEDLLDMTVKSYIPEEYKGKFDKSVKPAMLDWPWNDKRDHAIAYANNVGRIPRNLAKYMTDEEVNLLIYLENEKKNIESLDYLTSLTEQLEDRAFKTKQYETQRNDGLLDKVGYSISSLGDQAMSGIEGVQNLINPLLGKEIDETPYYTTLSQIKRSAVSEDMSGMGKFIYDTAMSGADSLTMTVVSMFLASGNTKAAKWIQRIGMGTQTMSSVIADSKKRGMGDWQSVTNGVVAGILEAYFEERGLGALFDGKTFANSFMKYLGKNIAQNAIEEAETEVWQTITDAIIGQDKSNFAAKINEYESKGYSESGAAAMAVLSSLGDTVLAGLSGALMGLGFGVAGGVGHTINTNAADVRIGRQITELAHANTDLYGAAKLAEDAEINKILDAIYKAKEGSRAKYRLTGKLARKTETASKEYFTDEEAERFGESYEPTHFEREYGVYSEKVKTAAAVDLNEEAKALAAKDAGEDYGEKYEGETRDAYYKGLAKYENKGKAYQYPLWFEIARKMGQDSNGRSVDEMIKTLPFSDRRGVLSLDTDTIKAAFNDGKRIAEEIAEEQKAADERRRRGEERIAERKKAVEAEKGKESTEGEKTTSETTENTSNVQVSDEVKKAEAANELSPAQKTALKKIRQVMKYIPGYEVIVQKANEYDSKLGNENGYFDPSTRTIYLNIDAGKVTGKIKIRGQDVAVELYEAALESALTHEIGHAILEDSPKLWSELRDFIRTKLYREGGFQNLVKQRQKQYADVLGREISYEYAEEEVICNSLGDILTSERVMDELAGTHRNLFARIWRLVKDFFSKILKRMRSMDGDFAYKTTEQRVVEKALLTERRRLEDLFVKALRDASATSKATLALGKTEAQKNVQKSTENSAKSSENAENTQKTATQPQKNNGLDNGKWSLNIGDKSIAVAVEEKRDLLAIHNLTEKNLLDTLELGGFPMPSIAIIRSGQEHSKYGNISVIFGRETIDPKKSSYNKVYGGDAWTPTYPRIEYKANPKVAKRISDKYYELQKKYGYDAVRAMYSYANEIEDRLNGLKGEKGLLDELYDSTRMMQVYLMDSGKGRIETIQKEIRKEMTQSEIQLNEFFIRELGEEFLDAFKAPPGASPFSYVKEFVENNEERIKEVFSKYLMEELGFAEDLVQNVVAAQRPGDYAKMLRDANRYRHEGAVSVKTEDDFKATDEAIRKAADNEEYRAWIDSLFKGVQDKSGIRNSKDYFDSYGNSRSWEQLHYENTIDNVIRVMREDVETGGQTIFSGNSIWGVAAKEYKSIDAVKADKGRLKTIPEEEYKAMSEELGGRLEKIAQSIKRDSEDNIFIAVDEAMKLIVDCVRTCKTKASMLAYLKKYNRNATEKTVDDIVSLVTDIANMPTGYFEAKPRRAVDFSEIQMVELPDSASEHLKEELTKRNIPFEIYGSTDAERSVAVNRLENVKFSLNDSGLDNLSKNGYTYTEEQYNRFGWAREAKGLTKNELDDLYSKIKEKASLQSFKRSSSGEFIIEVNDDPHKTLGVDNVFVFVTGTKQNFTIKKVVRFDVQTETEMEIFKEKLYERGTCSDTYLALYQKEGITREYRRKDSPTFVAYREGRSNGETSRRIDTYNRGRKKYGSGYSLVIGEDGEVTETAPWERKTVKESLEGKFSLRDTLAREQLSAMFYEMAATPVEREIVEKYKAEIVNIDAKIDERREILERLSEIEGKSGFGGERERLEGRLKGVNAYITGRDRRLFELESAKPFKEMVERYDAELAKKRESAPKALSNSRYAYVSRGKYNELRARERGDRFYTQKDAQKIERTIPGFDKLSRRKKNIIVDELWQGMNAAQTEKELEGVMRSVGNMIFEELSQSVKLENPEYAEIEQTLLYLSGYVQRLTFSDEMKGEIRHRLDESGVKSFMGRWQNKKSDGKAVSAEVFVTDFAREVDGYAYLEDMNAADALFEIDELYGRLKNVDENVDAFYNASTAELQAIRDSIDESLREAFAEGGKTSESEAKQKVNEVMSYHKATLAADREARSIRDLKRGTFDNANEIKGDRVMELLRELSKFEYRGTFSVNNFREKVRGLNEWYHSDNAENLLNKTKTEDGEYSAFVANTLQQISSGKGRVTADELWAFSKVLAHFRRIAEGYNKVWRAGKWEDALPIAQRYVGTLKLSRDLKGANTFFQKVYRMYFNEFADPLSVVRRYDGYIEDGYFTDMFLMFRDAAVELETTHSDVMKDYHTFLDKKENKHYLRDLQERYVEVYGERIPMEQALSLYMMLRQDHALMGFVDGGVQYKGFDGDMHMARSLASKANIELKIQLMAKEVAKDYGISMKEAEAKARETVTSDTFKTEDMTIDELRAAVKPTMDAIKEKMTDADRELLSIIEKSMNGTLRELKRATDLERLGFSNVMEGFYFPIKRAGTAEKVETLAYNDELQSVSNISANKSREQGARQPLRIDSIIKTYERHAKAIVTYATMQQAVDFYDRIYNVSVTGNPNDAEKVATAANEVWGPRKAETRGNHAFFKELIADIQGLKTGKESIFNDMVGLLRGGMATAGIGLNGKVLLSQWSSYAAALQEMSFGSLMKAAAKRFGIGAKGIFSKEGREALIEYGKIVDEYCPLARVRHEENYAYLAQGVIEKDDGTVKVKGKVTEGLNEFREATMKPIGWMDRAVVCTLFEACKYETATPDAPLDSEENLKAAGKKLEEVILNTQQNALATEKSRAMRSDQELMKGLVMFSSDSMRSLSRFLDYAGELHSINRQLKTFQMSDAAKETLQSRKKEVGRKLRNSIIAISANAIWMAALTLFFRFMRGKKIEREDILEDLALDIFTGYFGGMPLLRDLVDQVTKGYGVTDSALDSIGDFVGAFTSVFTTISKVIQGEREWGALVGQLRKFAFAIAQVTGIPVRNVWNCIYGWINIFSKDTADAIEGFLAG